MKSLKFPRTRFLSSELPLSTHRLRVDKHKHFVFALKKHTPKVMAWQMQGLSGKK